MAQPTPDSPDLLSKRKASVDSEEGQEEPRNVKRTRICPRTVLEDLKEYRIQLDTIVFNEIGTRKQGASADVELATLRLSPFDQITYGGDTMFVAVKKFRLSDDKGDQRTLASLAHEVSLTSELSHKNVIHLVGFAENIVENVAWVIHRWEANGNLREFLSSWDWEIPERVSLIYDISCGIKYLHTRTLPIYHGDLKSVMTGNIPFHNETNDIKLALQLATRTFNLPSITSHNHLSQIQVLCRLINNCWSVNVDARPNAGACASEIEVMVRTIPSNRNERASGGVRSIKLLDALGHLDLNNGKVDEAMKYFDQELELVLSSQDKLEGVGNGVNPGTVHHFRDGHPKAEATCAQSRESENQPYTMHATGRLQEDQIRHSQYERIEASYNEAKKAYNRIGHKTGTARAATKLADFRFLRKDYVQAEAFYSEAHTIYKEIEHQPSIAQLAQILGEVRYLQKDYSKAGASYNEALEIYRRIGNEGGVAKTSMELGEVLMVQERYPEAEQSFTRARAVYGRVPDRAAVARAIRRRGDVQVAQGKYDKAVASYIKARDLYRETGDELGVAVTTPKLADATRGLGDGQMARYKHAEAKASYIAARDISHEIGDQAGVANATRRLGDVQQAQEEYAEADAFYSKARDIFREIGDKTGVADATRRLGDIRQAQDQHAEAIASYHKARDLYREIGDEAAVTDATRRLANAILEAADRFSSYANCVQDRDVTDTLYSKARDLYRKIGDEAAVTDATRKLANFIMESAMRLFSYANCEQDCDEAEMLYAKARDLYHEIGGEAAVPDGTRRLANAILKSAMRLFISSDVAETLYAKARDLYHEIGDEAAVTDATRRLANSILESAERLFGYAKCDQDRDVAETLYTKARDLYREIGDEAAVTDATRRLANSILESAGRLYSYARCEQDRDKAETLYTKARDLYREVGSEAAVPDASRRLANAILESANELFSDANCERDCVVAETLYIKARDLYREIGDEAAGTDATRRLANAIIKFVDALLSDADCEQDRVVAETWHTKARDLYREIGDEAAGTDTTRKLANAILESANELFTDADCERDRDVAETLYAKARDLYREVGGEAAVPDATRRLANSILKSAGRIFSYAECEQDRDVAETLYAKARDLYHEVGGEAAVTDATRRLANAILESADDIFSDPKCEQDRDVAETLYTKARDLYREIGDEAADTDATRRLANSILKSAGRLFSYAKCKQDRDVAESLYAKARDLYREVGGEAAVPDATRRLANSILEYAGRIFSYSKCEQDRVVAETLYTKARDLYREIGDEAAVTDATRRLSYAQQDRH
ncbi:hypothetical protein FRC01_001554 [Tulasnella sp. 417]|nr:hypothetical protein FRC01_001554 [Tulasnella sp. 417]